MIGMRFKLLYPLPDSKRIDVSISDIPCEESIWVFTTNNFEVGQRGKSGENESKGY